MITNKKSQAEHYDSTRKETLQTLEAYPEKLEGINKSMPYFMPYLLIEKELDRLLLSSKKTNRLRMLEVGCGDGSWAAYWAYKGFEVTYLDISSVNVEIAKLRMDVNGLNSNTTPLVCSVTDIDVPDNYFDVIIGFGVIHHLTHEEEKLFWVELSRVMANNGSAFFLETLQNSKVLEYIRTIIPVRQKHNPRPSRFSKAFKKYKEKDPHPIRDNTKKHYVKYLNNAKLKYKIECIGVFSRLDRLTVNIRARKIIHYLDYYAFKFIHPVKYFARTLVIKVRKTGE